MSFPSSSACLFLFIVPGSLPANADMPDLPSQSIPHVLSAVGFPRPSSRLALPCHVSCLLSHVSYLLSRVSCRPPLYADRGTNSTSHDVVAATFVAAALSLESRPSPPLLLNHIFTAKARRSPSLVNGMSPVSPPLLETRINDRGINSSLTTPINWIFVALAATC
ncbi:hypothetical protein C8R44DRAFT_869037 [Mycena epipterygia]|nr:hypothetical protein C8R44DRAFT_869037 [Mycena epipterygia]